MGGPKKAPKKKDTLLQVLGRMKVQVPILSAVAMDQPMRDLLIQKLLQVVHQAANTLYVPEGMEVRQLPYEQFV